MGPASTFKHILAVYDESSDGDSSRPVSRSTIDDENEEQLVIVGFRAPLKEYVHTVNPFARPPASTTERTFTSTSGGGQEEQEPCSGPRSGSAENDNVHAFVAAEGGGVNWWETGEELLLDEAARADADGRSPSPTETRSRTGTLGAPTSPEPSTFFLSAALGAEANENNIVPPESSTDRQQRVRPRNSSYRRLSTGWANIFSQAFHSTDYFTSSADSLTCALREVAPLECAEGSLNIRLEEDGGGTPRYPRTPESSLRTLLSQDPSSPPLSVASTLPSPTMFNMTNEAGSPGVAAKCFSPIPECPEEQLSSGRNSPSKRLGKGGSNSEDGRPALGEEAGDHLLHPGDLRSDRQKLSSGGKRSSVRSATPEQISTVNVPASTDSRGIATPSSHVHVEEVWLLMNIRVAAKVKDARNYRDQLQKVLPPEQGWRYVSALEILADFARVDVGKLESPLEPNAAPQDPMGSSGRLSGADKRRDNGQALDLDFNGLDSKDPVLNKFISARMRRPNFHMVNAVV